MVTPEIEQAENELRKLDNEFAVKIAHFRRLLQKDRLIIPQSDTPTWLQNQLPALIATLGRGSFQIALDAERLIRAFLKRKPNCEAALEPGRLGTVEIRWQLPKDIVLTWIVHSTELPWPGVKVRVYCYEKSLEPRTFFYAQSVIDHGLQLAQPRMTTKLSNAQHRDRLARMVAEAEALAEEIAAARRGKHPDAAAERPHAEGRCAARSQCRRTSYKITRCHS